MTLYFRQGKVLSFATILNLFTIIKYNQTKHKKVQKSLASPISLKEAKLNRLKRCGSEIKQSSFLIKNMWLILIFWKKKHLVTLLYFLHSNAAKWSRRRKNISQALYFLLFFCSFIRKWRRCKQKNMFLSASNTTLRCIIITSGVFLLLSFYFIFENIRYCTNICL